MSEIGKDPEEPKPPKDELREAAKAYKAAQVRAQMAAANYADCGVALDKAAVECTEAKEALAQAKLAFLAVGSA